MNQSIRYCTASDGVRIAYSTAGSGPPLLVSSAWLGHLEFEWAQPTIRGFWETLAHGRMLIRYDKRGTGLSDWDVTDQSLEARVGDLACVAEALQLREFDLVGLSEGGATAIAFAARHPVSVKRLVLYGAYPRLEISPQFIEPLLALVGTEWGMGSAALSSVFVPSGDPANVAEFTALQRVSASGESAVRVLRMIATLNVTELLTQVVAPTLVLHRKLDTLHPFALGREIAATIPNASFLPLEGDVYPPWFGDSQAIIRAVHAFLGTEADLDAAANKETAPQRNAHGTAIMLFADIVDSTRLTESIGDAAFRARAHALDGSLRSIITSTGGTPIDGKLLGDGVLATFQSAAQAVDAALQLEGAAEAEQLELHIGLHAGDVIREHNNVFGGAVNIASRISALSAPGEVLVSDIVRGLARTSAGVRFEDRGEHALKGVGDPQRIFVVRTNN